MSNKKLLQERGKSIALYVVLLTAVILCKTFVKIIWWVKQCTSMNVHKQLPDVMICLEIPRKKEKSVLNA